MRRLSIAFVTVFAFSTGLLAETPVGLELGLDRAIYRRLSSNTAYLKATIKTGESPDLKSEQHRPLNIAFAVDSSGSMEGEKLDAAKNAIREAILVLSSSDRVSLLAYGSEIETLIPSTAVDQLTLADPAIENLLAEGGSALFDAIEAAANELRSHATPDSTNLIALISDGKANKGPRESDDFIRLGTELGSSGISLTAIGLGDKYDEETLYQLASTSGGIFRSARNPAKLPSILKEEISKLNRAIAKDAVLEIVFVGTSRVEKSLGRAAEIERRSARFRFDHLYALQELSVALQAELPADRATGHRQRIARATLTYSPIDKDSKEPVVIEADVRASFVDSGRSSYRSIDLDVLRTICVFQVADSIREAFSLFDDGNQKQALKDLRNLARQLRILESDFEDMRVGSQIAALNRAIADIESGKNSAIEQTALTNTLYPRTLVAPPSKPAAAE